MFADDPLPQLIQGQHSNTIPIFKKQLNSVTQAEAGIESD